MLIFTAVSSFASDWASETRPLVVLDEAPVFDVIAFDTGYWPSATDPIAIRFYVTPDGGVSTSLLATSELEWPEFSHRFADAEGGFVELDGGITIGSDIQIDILGIFTGVVTLVEERVGFSDLEEVEGLLLPHGPSTSVVLGDDKAVFPPLDYAFTIVPGVDLVVGITVTPTVEATLSGAQLSGSTSDLFWFQEAADEWVELEPDPERPSEVGIVATWSADLSSVLSIVLEPSVTLSTAVGDFELVSIPIPVDLASGDERRTPTPQFMVHPLPVVDELPPLVDFGEVPLGQDVSFELPVVDLGELMLEGTVSVLGENAFSVWPQTVLALPNTADGLSIAFAPDEVGQFDGELWLETNDPTRPLVRIALTGVGVAVQPGGGGVEVGPSDIGPAAYCGCAAGGHGARPLGWVALAALLIRHRRR